jgi:hypothetical protein
VGSSQPTEIKTKNLENLGLDKETDLRDFEKENSSRRISEGPGATTPEQQQGILARKNIIFEGYFTNEEKKKLKEKINKNQFDNEKFLYKPINFINKNSINDQEVQNFRIRRRVKLMGGMFEERFDLEEQFDNDIFENLNFDYIMTLTFNNDAIFIQEVIDEGQMNRTSIM